MGNMKTCAMCGETFSGDALQCPSCGSGIFTSNKKVPHTDPTLSLEDSNLLSAVISGNENMVKEHLETGLSPNIIDEDGNPLLNIASQIGNFAIVKILLEHGANINDTNRYGATALIAAALKGSNSILKLLLDKNADTKIKAQDETAFSVSEKNANCEAMELLLSRDIKVSKFMPLILRLVILGQEDRTENGFEYLGINKKKIRKIGSNLNKAGGIRLMLLALATVRNKLGNVASRELEAAWDGIGEWLG